MVDSFSQNKYCLSIPRMYTHSCSQPSIMLLCTMTIEQPHTTTDPYWLWRMCINNMSIDTANNRANNQPWNKEIKPFYGSQPRSILACQDWRTTVVATSRLPKMLGPWIKVNQGGECIFLQYAAILPTVHTMDSRVDEIIGCVGVALDPQRIWGCRRYLLLVGLGFIIGATVQTIHIGTAATANIIMDRQCFGPMHDIAVTINAYTYII